MHISRGVDVAEKSAREAREKQRRRAEIYAINAVMRSVDAYILEVATGGLFPVYL